VRHGEETDEIDEMTKWTRQTGFTLIEVMIAMTLLALMVAVLYGAFFLGHRAAEKARVRFDKSQTLRSVGEYLGTLIRSAYPYRSSGEGSVPFSGEKEQLSFVSAVSMGVEGRGVSKISLSWNGGGGDVTLVEEAPVWAEGHGNTITLWKGAEDLTLEYLDSEDDEERWVNEWDGETKKSLPRAVRVSLRDSSGKELRWVFPIMIQVLSPS